MSRYVMSYHVLPPCLAHPGFLRSDRVLMYSSDSEPTSADSGSDCLEDSPVDSWDARPSIAINDYPVSLRREQELSRSQAGRLAALQRRREELLEQYDFPDLEQDSIVNMPEAQQLRVWCEEASWSFCLKCGKLSPAKLLPSFRTRKPNVLDHSCKCVSRKLRTCLWCCAT